MVSQITFIGAGFEEPGYEHILSFDRQVFISPDENNPLPETFLLNYDSTEYRIFLSDAEKFCNLCKQTDHYANQCENTLSINIPNNKRNTEGNVDKLRIQQNYDKEGITAEIYLESNKKQTKRIQVQQKKYKQLKEKKEDQPQTKQEQQQQYEGIQQEQKRIEKPQQQKQSQKQLHQHQKQQTQAQKHQHVHYQEHQQQEQQKLEQKKHKNKKNSQKNKRDNNSCNKNNK